MKTDIERKVEDIMMPFAKHWRWFCDGPWVVLAPPYNLITAETMHYVEQHPLTTRVEAVFRSTPHAGVYLRFLLSTPGEA